MTKSPTTPAVTAQKDALSAAAGEAARKLWLLRRVARQHLEAKRPSRD